MPPDHQVAVIRIAQEAVANVVRHAEAHALRIHVQFGTRTLRLTIADDGRGFSVEQDFHAYAGHFGLLGMQERAAGLGGALMVESSPHGGTRITLLLPETASQRYRASAGRL